MTRIFPAGQMLRAGALVALATLVAAPALAQAPASLRVAAVPSLVNCGEGACFRMLLNAYDAEDKPMPVSADALFEISEVGAPAPVAPDPTAVPDPTRPRGVPVVWWQYRLFENLGRAAGAGSQAQTQQAKPRYLLLVVDTSGSMLEPVSGGSGTKFEAAVGAIRTTFLADFKAGVDRMAIVGFDSRRVRARIESGAFEDSLAAVQAQLDGLAPARQGNTALYSAVDAALDKLKALGESGRAADAQIQLLVFTDGKNDVHADKGDDSGLLEGAGGLATVEKKVRAVTNTLKGLEVITVGLGDAGRTYDPEALRRLAFPDAKNAMDASSVSSLQRAFDNVREQMLNRVFLTFGPVRHSKDEVTNPIVFNVTMRTPAGSLSARSPAFQPPPIGVPPWDGDLTPNERIDFLKRPAEVRQPTTILDSTLLMRLLVLATFSLTLAVLWFGLPRLVWPERYVPRPSFQVAAAPPARAAARPAGGRHGTQKGVTITGRAVTPQRGAGGGSGPATVTPSRIRDAGEAPQAPSAPPARPRGAPPAAPQRPAREPFVRNAGDATVFVPPNQNRGGGDN
jgi:hypothetical protein